ncbi:hypothetical protein NEUTE2DRAFT_132457 [Neurospora tetrasperma FGSC 2509]|nr:hypothetical protein NEUTE2DRAFT_132457 [Neurospora tetrasperma FGSC 2509]
MEGSMGEEKEKRQRSNLDDEKQTQAGSGDLLWLTYCRVSNDSKRVFVATLKSATLRDPSEPGQPCRSACLYGNGKIANTYCITWRKRRYQAIEQRVGAFIGDFAGVLSSVWTVDADDDFLPLPARLFTFSTVGLRLSTLPAAICTWPHQEGQSGEEANLQWVPGQFEAVPAPGPCPPKTELGVHVGHRRP